MHSADTPQVIVYVVFNTNPKQRLAFLPTYQQRQFEVFLISIFMRRLPHEATITILH